MFKKNSKSLMFFGLAPLIVWLSMVFKGEIRLATIMIGVLLFIIGYGVSSNNKNWIISSVISLITICVVLIIMGLSNDYFKLLECYMAAGMAIYYGGLHVLNYKFNTEFDNNSIKN
ncbi:MAG: hypothetical protein ACRDA5_07550 [Clostridium sp.]